MWLFPWLVWSAASLVFVSPCDLFIKRRRGSQDYREHSSKLQDSRTGGTRLGRFDPHPDNCQLNYSMHDWSSAATRRSRLEFFDKFEASRNPKRKRLKDTKRRSTCSENIARVGGGAICWEGIMCNNMFELPTFQISRASTSSRDTVASSALDNGLGTQLRRTGGYQNCKTPLN